MTVLYNVYIAVLVYTLVQIIPRVSVYVVYYRNMHLDVCTSHTNAAHADQ